MAALWVLPGAASAANLVVNTTTELPPTTTTCGLGGDEPCLSLNNAILESNTSEGVRDTITFAGLPAGSVIAPAAQLPTIDDAVTIDGFTTAGPATGNPQVELSGAESGAFAGLTVQGPTGVRIEGLAIGGFGDGIAVDPEEGANTTDTQICGDYLGVALDGETADPNQLGVEIFANQGEEGPVGTVIGDGAGCPGNVISGNSQAGVVDEGKGTVIAGDRIGVGAAPADAELPNGLVHDFPTAGLIEGASSEAATIGGTASAAEANRIWFNSGPGVRVASSSSNVAIHRNSIFANETVGIEVEEDFLSPPTISKVETVGPGELLIEGAIEAPGAEETELEFFGNETCGAGGTGQGQTFLAAETLAVHLGVNEFAFTVAADPVADTGFTATATEEDGPTSSFSECFAYDRERTLSVNTVEDVSEPGERCVTACSLRDAIALADQTGERDTIDFAGIPSGSAIELQAPLPSLDSEVTVDGFATEDPVTGQPGVELIGLDAPAGLEVEGASNVRIEGLAIVGFEGGVGIKVKAGEGTMTGTEICGNHLGVTADGEGADPDRIGVEVEAGDGFVPEETVIGEGAGCPGNVISDNLEAGIDDGGIGTTIGGAGAGEVNVIARNSGPGVLVENGGSGASIRQNSIFGNAGKGIEIVNGAPPVPTLSSVTSPAPGVTRVEGTLEGVQLGETSEVDIFANARTCASGKAQGQTYLGTALVSGGADGPAGWSIELPVEVPTGETGITATSTHAAGTTDHATSEFSACVTYVPPRPPPAVTVTAAQPATTSATAATFKFAAAGAGATGFECSLDGAAFAACASPHTVKGLALGPHTFEVRAVGTGQRVGPPTTRQWNVVELPTPGISSAPPATTEATGATFAFDGGGNEEVTGFECSLDGAAFSACASPQSFAGLAPGAHTFAVRSTSGNGATSQATTYRWTVASPPPPPAQSNPPAQSGPPTQAIVTPPPGPTPINGETIVVEPEEGKVKIKLPGTNRFVPLEELKEIPVGAVIDATKGKVHLVSIDPDGTEQEADFFGGVFKVKQKEGAGLVVLELLDTQICKAARKGGKKGKGAEGAVLARPAGNAAGKLWGSGHGNFRTEGNDGSATVRGTIWLVEDRCNGTTFFRTRRGVVSVRDFVLHKTLSLPAGKSYVAGEG